MKECLNTTIEIMVDRISLEYHDLSGLAKDVAISVVMLAQVNAAIVIVPKSGKRCHLTYISR